MVKRGKNKVPIIVIAIIIAIVLIAIAISTAKKSAIGANIALIYINNEILLTESPSFLPYAATYADDVIGNIEGATASPSIKAIIFEINSPGGSAVASSEIADAIKKVQAANKTAVALIREQGTSGAYWIASSCEHVIAHPLAITGSIGVLASYLEISGLLERYNITYERLVKGEHKDILSPFRELSDEERSMIEKKLDIIYKTFIEEVALNRNLSKEQVQELADGMFCLGKEAKELGLVDELGSRQEAINYVEAKHNIKARIKEYKKEKSLFEQFAEFYSMTSFWLGRGIGASFIDKNLIASLNSIMPRT